MKVESVRLKNFRCFGPDGVTIDFATEVTTLIGPNGAGKTAALLGLLRMFGPSEELRRVRLSDFHVPVDEAPPPTERTLSLEAVLAFPELKSGVEEAKASVPPFFLHLASGAKKDLKCRILLKSTWTNDGTADGAVESRLYVVKTLKEQFDDTDLADFPAADRAKIQVIYVPASRDAASQVTNLLRSRIWKAINWSKETRTAAELAASDLATAFDTEPAVKLITASIKRTWGFLHDAGTDAKPAFRPIDRRFEDFIRKVELVLHPDEHGQDRSISLLSDGQRSMLHIAMTASVLDIEAKVRTAGPDHFNSDLVSPPALTLMAIEEPENCLAPFFLARIMGQVREVASRSNAQAVVSSHSPSILTRSSPEDIRHFRLDRKTRVAGVRKIPLPDDADEAGKFVREAVRAYPELYFARVVILGEGASEEIVLPRIADAMGLDVDRSFVAVVPLGGRHVQHLWRLLRGLDIPHVTLLDFDLGRHGGGWGRIKNAIEHLRNFGAEPSEITGGTISTAEELEEALSDFDSKDGTESKEMELWRSHLRDAGVFFSVRLDLDWAMLQAFPQEYRKLEDASARGPSGKPAKDAVLRAGGRPVLYESKDDEAFAWYRYLFLGRGKPTTHLRALGLITPEKLKEKAPPSIKKLLERVNELLEHSADEDDDILG